MKESSISRRKIGIVCGDIFFFLLFLLDNLIRILFYHFFLPLNVGAADMRVFLVRLEVEIYWKSWHSLSHHHDHNNKKYKKFSFVIRMRSKIQGYAFVNAHTSNFHHQQVREEEQKWQWASDEGKIPKLQTQERKVWLDINFCFSLTNFHFLILLLLDFLSFELNRKIFFSFFLLYVRVLDDIGSFLFFFLFLFEKGKSCTNASEGKSSIKKVRTDRMRVREEKSQMSQTHCRCCATRMPEHEVYPNDNFHIFVRFFQHENVELSWIVECGGSLRIKVSLTFD